MKFIVIILVTIFAESLWAESFSMVHDGKKQTIEVFKFKDIHLSKICFANKGSEPRCDAYSVLGKKIKTTRTIAPSLDNPASYFCKHMGGQNRIIKNNVSTEFDYCEFQDRSLIDAWDLYLHFHSKKIS